MNIYQYLHEQGQAETLKNSIVVEVLNGNPENGICIIRAEDGSLYRLCATELGWWLEDVSVAKEEGEDGND